MTNESYKEIMELLKREGAIGQLEDVFIQSKDQDLKDISKVCKAIIKNKHVQYACKPFKDTLCSWSCESCRNNENCNDNVLHTGCKRFIPIWKDLKPTDTFESRHFVYRILKK